MLEFSVGGRLVGYTAKQISNLPAGQLIALIEEHLDEGEYLEKCESKLDLVFEAKFGDKIDAAYRRLGANYGTVTIRVDDGFILTVTRPLLVRWEVTKLIEKGFAIDQLGGNPNEYIEIEYHMTHDSLRDACNYFLATGVESDNYRQLKISVSERKHNAWDEDFKLLFSDARTVFVGKSTYDLKREDS